MCLGCTELPLEEPAAYPGPRDCQKEVGGGVAPPSGSDAEPEDGDSAKGVGQSWFGSHRYRFCAVVDAVAC